MEVLFHLAGSECNPGLISQQGFAHTVSVSAGEFEPLRHFITAVVV